MEWDDIELLIQKLKYVPCPFAYGHRLHCRVLQSECLTKVLELDHEDGVGICLPEDIPAADSDVLLEVMRGILIELLMIQGVSEERLIVPLREIKECLEVKGEDSQECSEIMFIFAVSTLPSMLEEWNTCVECLYSNATRSKK